MAPTRPRTKKRGTKSAEKQRSASGPSTTNPRQLITDATSKLQQGDAETAVRIAEKALDQTSTDGRYAGACLSLLGQIHVELGDIEKARTYFVQAVATDEDGTLPEETNGGPEKFLWLAQLSEEGGQDSVTWYERGATALRKQIQGLTDSLPSLPQSRDLQDAIIDEKKRRLAEILCAVAEVYMTDLSWEEEAEQRCEALITEAGLLAPEMPETWQTIANVRISQEKTDDARVALQRSLALWEDLPPDDPAVPPFPTRVSLVRLLVEIGMEEKAYEVAHRMLQEDDTSVEVAYLGGFAMYLFGEKEKAQQGPDSEVWKGAWRAARAWLSNCLRMFEIQDYEDEQLGEHAKELLEAVHAEVGEAADGEDGWEDTDDEDEEDEEMT